MADAPSAAARAHPSAPPRLAGLDAVKAAAIALVVLIHAAPVEPSAYRSQVIQGLARLAVPIFLVVTGYLAGRKGTSRDKLAGYFRRFLALHLGYGAFYWALDLVHHGAPGTLTPKAVLLHFGAGAYAGQFYFAILLQLFFLAAFALPERFWRRAAWLPVSAAAALGGALLLQAEPDGGTPLGWIARARENPFWLWLFYFQLGGLLGARAADATLRALAPGRAFPAALLVAGVAVVVLGAPPPGAEGTLRYARVSILAGSTLVALAVPALAALSAPAWLRGLGRESFGIYVLNPAILGVLFSWAGQPATPWGSWLFAGITLASAFAATRVLRRYAPFALP